MTDMTMTCGELEHRLAEYLEGTLDAPRRAAVERHLAGCARCTALVAALDERPAAAASLPVLSPERDLWSGIAERIESRVLPLAERRSAPVARRSWRIAQYAAAAAVLVAATAVVTRAIVLKSAPPAAAPEIAGAVPGSRKTPGVLASDRQQQLIRTYQDEILRLDSAVTQRRGQLDAKTVKIVEKNLKLIDRAIAESEEALVKDPNSRFLNDQLAHVLDQKVGLLRTIALLPSST